MIGSILLLPDMGDACAQVSAGGEGYRADGPTNPPHNNWYSFSCSASLEIIICFAYFMTAELQQSRSLACCMAACDRTGLVSQTLNMLLPFQDQWRL